MPGSNSEKAEKFLNFTFRIKRFAVLYIKVEKVFLGKGREEGSNYIWLDCEHLNTEFTEENVEGILF